MSKIFGLGTPAWIAIWAVALILTSIGGNRETINWKAEIQLPGSFVVPFLGWFVGPFATIMTPLVDRILTILINVIVYYVLVRMFLFFRTKLKT
jgi:hypothetical protein